MQKNDEDPVHRLWPEGRHESVGLKNLNKETVSRTFRPLLRQSPAGVSMLTICALKV